MSSAGRAARYIDDHPGCKVSDVMNALDLDAAGAWEALVEAERVGLVIREHDGAGWTFRTAA